VGIPVASMLAWGLQCNGIDSVVQEFIITEGDA
jgi:hypothetical protein